MQSSFQNQNLSLESKALEEINKLRDIFIKENYLVDTPVKKEYNYEVNISKGKDRLKLLVYFGKKGIRSVLQGNIKSELYRQIDSLINMTLNFSEPEIEEPEFYIGTDESGKGDFFGPLVIAAFAYDQTVKENISGLNIRDSKELSSDEIKFIASEIKKKFGDRFSVIVIHPSKYNKLYESFQNLNSIMIWAHTKAIDEIRKKYNYSTFVIDKFCKEDAIRNELVKKYNDFNLILTEKAERFKGVALASIIARDRILNWFENKSRELKIDLPLGASEKVNDVASHIIKKYGKKFLDDLVKLHFKNFRTINE